MEHLKIATVKLLDMFNNYGVKATFFILGATYECCPSLIEEIESRGHEIAFHGFSHQKIDKCDLNNEIRKSKAFLDRFAPTGFRAPEAFIKRKHLKILEENGFLYDSSTYGPTRLMEYFGRILEIPISSFPLWITKKEISFPRNLTRSIMSHEIPYGSGYFIGLLPKILLSKLISHTNENEAPAVIFFHPWQIYPYRWNFSAERAILFHYYYVNISEKLKYILKKHRFGPFRDTLEFWQDAPKGKKILSQSKLCA